jgi:hypothetical protein
MNAKTKATIIDQLTQCVTKSITHANESLGKKDIDRALRALQVCQQALALLELLFCVSTMIDPPINE